MKKTIAILTSLALGFLAAPLALHAEDSTTPTDGDNGGCHGGSCNGGGFKHHKKHHDDDGDKGDKPAPTATPAQ